MVINKHWFNVLNNGNTNPNPTNPTDHTNHNTCYVPRFVLCLFILSSRKDAMPIRWCANEYKMCVNKAVQQIENNQ